MSSLTETIKRIALEAGAGAAGIAGRPALAGPPETDMGYLMPSARFAVAFLCVEDESDIMKYLSKEDPKPYQRRHMELNLQLIRIGNLLGEHLRRQGYSVTVPLPNVQYRPGSDVTRNLIPPFSHAYACAAAGIGTIGLNGILTTPEWGSRVMVSSILTDAPLAADAPLDHEVCERCGICLNACPGEYRSRKERVTFTLGEREITVAKRHEIPARCVISCMGYTGRSRDGTWSTWSTGEHTIPEDDGELLRLFKDLLQREMDEMQLRGEILDRTPIERDEHEIARMILRTRVLVPPQVAFQKQAMTCGNCSIVCFETKEKRARALKALRHSGIVVRGANGEPTVVKPASRASVA